MKTTVRYTEGCGDASTHATVGVLAWADHRQAAFGMVRQLASADEVEALAQHFLDVAAQCYAGAAA